MGATASARQGAEMSRRARSRRSKRRRREQMAKRYKNARKAKGIRASRSKRLRKERDRRVTELYGQSGHRSCGRKARYPSLAAAELVMETRRRRGATETLRAYPCRMCGGWHITKSPLKPWRSPQDVVDGGAKGADGTQDVV